ncbi:MAG: 50S ribosomal protein L25/general stress protein Ctc [Proteobacteria bacterium]|nr:50S ribosomal protein L25/general stress protein Ctc [Pseudomonadota bacterium]
MEKNLNTLEVNVRETKTKADVKKLRLDGFVPGVLYGDIDKNLNLSIKKNSLEKFLKSGNFMSKVIEIKVDGKDYKVLPRAIEFNKLTNQPIHIDFQTLSAGTKVVVWIPVKFINENICPGLKMGGVLNIVRRKVELSCPADQIPSELIVDLAEKQINESIHISAVKLPENVKPTILDRDFTIATVAAPTVVKEPEPAAAEAVDEGTEGAEGAAASADGAADKKDAKTQEDKAPADKKK